MSLKAGKVMHSCEDQKMFLKEVQYGESTENESLSLRKRESERGEKAILDRSRCKY